MRRILTSLIVLIQMGGPVSCFAESSKFTFNVLRNTVVNDTTPDAISPSGIASTSSGKWILTFVDKGDVAAGSKVYFVESKDSGKNWSKPYKIIEPENANMGCCFAVMSLEDGRILGVKTTFHHINNFQSSATMNARTSKTAIMISSDEGHNFTLLQELKTPANSVLACMNSLVKLKNGDMILPAYCYPTLGKIDAGAVYGSGFFRSRDSGKTWGGFELAFKEVSGARKLGFNESAFAVKDDGSIVGFARIDSRPVNNMWKITSNDNGKTWTMPAETNIPGNFPEIKQLGNGLYLMVCGLVEKNSRPTVLFVSEDGENYERLGMVYYSRPEYNGGRSWGSGHGGTQSIIPVGNDRACVVFYGGDMELKGINHTYIDSCLIEVKKQSNQELSQSIIVSLPENIKMVMNYVAPGSFQMSSRLDTNSMSLRKVILHNAFYLSKYEITQAQYQAIMKTNSSEIKGVNYPVENVSWYDAADFCRELTLLERRAQRLLNNEIYRLPTEAEWEFAARGGNSSRNYEFSGGLRKNLNDLAWYCGNSNYEKHEVGLKQPNELGFCDMSGNVWEWVDDWYGNYLSSEAVDTERIPGASEKTIRGGSWSSLSVDCRVFSRSNVAPDRRLRCLGFRVLRTISH